MSSIETSIEVDLPVRSVYNQWTQFEDFPKFMDGIERVEQVTDRRLCWYANINGVKRSWYAEIVEQIPDERIQWRSLEGLHTAGRVQFEELAPDRTKVTLFFDFDPEGFVETAGDALGIVGRRAMHDLERFKDFVEERGMETGDWRGEIRNGVETKPDEPDSEINLEDQQAERSVFPQEGMR